MKNRCDDLMVNEELYSFLVQACTLCPLPFSSLLQPPFVTYELRGGLEGQSSKPHASVETVVSNSTIFAEAGPVPSSTPSRALYSPYLKIQIPPGAQRSKDDICPTDKNIYIECLT
jgi:hypothetical protein